jgi:hypothetical protein
LPFSVSYDPTRDLVATFPNPSNSRYQLTSVYLPAGATSESALLTISASNNGKSNSAENQILDIQMTSTDCLREINRLDEPMQIRTWNSSEVPLMSENLDQFRALPSLPKLGLGDGQFDGYFRFANGDVLIITKKLSKFATQVSSNQKIAIRKIKLGYAFIVTIAERKFVAMNYPKRFTGRNVLVEIRNQISSGLPSLTEKELTLNSLGNGVVEITEYYRNDTSIKIWVSGRESKFSII